MLAPHRIGDHGRRDGLTVTQHQHRQHRPRSRTERSFVDLDCAEHANAHERSVEPASRGVNDEWWPRVPDEYRSRARRVPACATVPS